jgi:hypothetical protein
VALTPDEKDALARLEKQHEDNRASDTLYLRYYQGSKRIEQLGMAIPPKMRRFLVVANWCRVMVDTIESRQSVRYLQLPGAETTDERLRAIANASHLSSQLRMFQRDRMTRRRGRRSRRRSTRQIRPSGFAGSRESGSRLTATTTASVACRS